MMYARRRIYLRDLGRVVYILRWMLYCKACLQWLTVGKALVLLDQNLTWGLELWTLCDDNYSIAERRPYVVPIKRLQAEVQLWPPPVKAKVGKAASSSTAIVPPDSGPAADPGLLAIEDAYDADAAEPEGTGGDEDLDEELAALLYEGEFLAVEDGDADAPERGKSDAFCEFPNGIISFYKNKGDFEARCRCHRAERCVLTRQNVAYNDHAAPNDEPRGGRPLGLMVAWLARGECACKSDHKESLHDINLEERINARVRSVCLPGFAELMSFERHELGDGELPVEPKHV